MSPKRPSSDLGQFAAEQSHFMPEIPGVDPYNASAINRVVFGDSGLPEKWSTEPRGHVDPRLLPNGFLESLVGKQPDRYDPTVPLTSAELLATLYGYTDTTAERQALISAERQQRESTDPDWIAQNKKIQANIERADAERRHLQVVVERARARHQDLPEIDMDEIRAGQIARQELRAAARHMKSFAQSALNQTLDGVVQTEILDAKVATKPVEKTNSYNLPSDDEPLGLSA